MLGCYIFSAEEYISQKGIIFWSIQTRNYPIRDENKPYLSSKNVLLFFQLVGTEWWDYYPSAFHCLQWIGSLQLWWKLAFFSQRIPQPCWRKLTLLSPDGTLMIPANYFDKHSGLLYLPNCNYSVEKLGRKIPLFYRELLDHFRELRSNYDDPLEDESILWNNTDRNIESENNQSFGRPGAIVMVFKTLPISSYGPWGSKLKLRKLRFPTI